MNIRTADIADVDQIRRLYLDAFGDEEKESVANLACDLLNETSKPDSLHLVADVENGIGGHVAFSPVWSKTSRNLIAYILAPLAVAPEKQNTGIGSQLVREGLRILEARNTGQVLVYGSPDYYGRFGFTAELAKEFIPPFKLQYSFGWQAVQLESSVSDVHAGPIACVKALNKPELW